MGSHRSSIQHTITKKGPDQFDSLVEVDGKPHVEETCSRAANG